MFCPNCGTKLEDGASFCTECGMKLDDIENRAKTTAAAPTTSRQTTPQQPAARPMAPQPQQARQQADRQQTARQQAPRPQQVAASQGVPHPAPQTQMPTPSSMPGTQRQQSQSAQFSPSMQRYTVQQAARIMSSEQQASTYQQRPASRPQPRPQPPTPVVPANTSKKLHTTSAIPDPHAQKKHRSKQPLIIVLCVVAALVVTFGVTYFGMHLYELPFGLESVIHMGSSSGDAEVSNIAQSGYVASDDNNIYYVYAPNALGNNAKDSHPGIFVCKSDGTGKHQVVVVDENVWISRVNVVNDNLVFLEKITTDAGSTYEVHMVKTDGSDDKVLMSTPDGQEISGVFAYSDTAYAVVSTTDGVQVWQAPLNKDASDSRPSTQVTSLSIDPSLAKSVMVTRDKKILYVQSTKQGDLPTYTICSQTLNGDSQTTLYSDSTHLVGWARPSGNRVYFTVADRDTNELTVMSVQANGTDQKTLYTSESNCENPGAAIVGKNYLLTYTKGGQTKTVCIPLDGSSTSTLSVPGPAAQSKVGNTYLIYDSNGKAVIFGAQKSGDTAVENVYLMGLDGTDATSLAD